VPLPSGPVASVEAVERAMFDFVDAYDQAFTSAAERHGLTAAQACVLGRLDTAWSMGALATELGCDASNVTQIVAKLERRGLAERRPNPADGRSRLIARTALGDEIYASFETTFQFARAATARLTPGEREQLTALLLKVLGTAP
jgi:DNA-binding MarR family transcriptional regulator